MVTSLSDKQWGGVEAGHVTSPVGTQFRRRSSRLARAKAAELVEEGSPVLVYDFAQGLMDWHATEEAPAVWAAARKDYTSSEPRPKPKMIQWTGGRWEAETGQLLLVLTVHC